MAVLDGQLGDDQRHQFGGQSAGDGEPGGNTVYRAVVTNGVCGEVYSTEAAVAWTRYRLGARRWRRLGGLLQQRHARSL